MQARRCLSFYFSFSWLISYWSRATGFYTPCIFDFIRFYTGSWEISNPLALVCRQLGSDNDKLREAVNNSAILQVFTEKKKKRAESAVRRLCLLAGYVYWTLNNKQRIRRRGPGSREIEMRRRRRRSESKQQRSQRNSPDRSAGVEYTYRTKSQMMLRRSMLSSETGARICDSVGDRKLECHERITASFSWLCIVRWYSFDPWSVSVGGIGGGCGSRAAANYDVFCYCFPFPVANFHFKIAFFCSQSKNCWNIMETWLFPISFATCQQLSMGLASDRRAAR